MALWMGCLPLCSKPQQLESRADKQGSRAGGQASITHVSSFLLGSASSGMLHRCSAMGW